MCPGKVNDVVHCHLILVDKVQRGRAALQLNQINK